jgi:hypothetical protein
MTRIKDQIVETFDFGSIGKFRVMYSREVPYHMQDCFYLNMKRKRTWATLNDKFETESGAHLRIIRILEDLHKYGRII